jgi:hypothetical protein
MAGRRLLLAVVITLTAAASYAQAAFAGKWTNETPSPGDPVIVLQLVVKGSGVTGSVTVGESPAQAISDGKIDGTRLSFKTTTMLNGKEADILWDGEVRDNRLTLVRTFGTSGRKLPPIVTQRSK